MPNSYHNFLMAIIPGRHVKSLPFDLQQMLDGNSLLQKIIYSMVLTLNFAPCWISRCWNDSKNFFVINSDFSEIAISSTWGGYRQQQHNQHGWQITVLNRKLQQLWCNREPTRRHFEKLEAVWGVFEALKVFWKNLRLWFCKIMWTYVDIVCSVDNFVMFIPQSIHLFIL